MEPRFQKHLKNEKPYFARKLFQVQMSSFFQQRKENLSLQFFAETYFLVVSNAALLGWYFSRSPHITICFYNIFTLVTTCYASLVVLTYGHTVDFHKSLKHDTPQSIYTRLLYRENFGQKEYDDVNAKFIKRFQFL